MTTLEFWPDYGGALLWTDSGERVSIDELSLPADLVDRARRWITEYDDSKLPWEAARDEAWLADGRRLFEDLRSALLERGIELEPNEALWAEPD